VTRGIYAKVGIGIESNAVSLLQRAAQQYENFSHGRYCWVGICGVSFNGIVDTPCLIVTLSAFSSSKAISAM
jgi:hypothetical protein